MHQHEDVIDDFREFVGDPENEEFIRAQNLRWGVNPDTFLKPGMLPNNTGRNWDRGWRSSRARFAHHKFQHSNMDQFSMWPTKMRDYNCVYESLMVIKHMVKYGCLPVNNDRHW